MNCQNPVAVITPAARHRPMPKARPPNERIKREYFAYLEEALGLTVATVDQVAANLAAFEGSTKYRDFKAFHVEQARKFKRDLKEEVSGRTGKPLSIATINLRLKTLRSFFIWLAGQPGYRSRLKYSDADYFNLTQNEERIAYAERERIPPTIPQIKAVLSSMPFGTEIEKRDRALIAFTLLSGARDNAIASLSLKHVDLGSRTVFQDARQVRTKNRKTFTSWFFPVGDDVESIVRSWIDYLVQVRGFGPEDPLFPVTLVRLDEAGHFGPTGVGRSHWSNPDPIRKIFARAFRAAGLPYANPHSFRHTLTLFGQRFTQGTEQLKIWSQNLGHEKVMTTVMAYGEVASDRQGEVMNAMPDRVKRDGENQPGDPDPETVAAVVAYFRRLAQ